MSTTGPCSTAVIVTMGAGGLLATVMIPSLGFFTKKGLVTLITLISGSSVVLILRLSQWIWLSALIMLLMGLSQTHFIVANQTLAPDSLRGRVTRVWHYESGLVPLFAAITGGVDVLVGIDTEMAIGGVIAVTISLVFLVRFDNIRLLD